MKASPLPTLLIGPVALYASMALADDTQQQASALPKRAPGLWRITTISPEIGMQTNEVCIEDSDSIIGTLDGTCDTPAVTRAGDQVIVTIECGPAGRRDLTSLLFTGDFKKWYRAQSRATAGASRSGFTIDAKFVGAQCRRGRAV